MLFKVKGQENNVLRKQQETIKEIPTSLNPHMVRDLITIRIFFINPEGNFACISAPLNLKTVNSANKIAAGKIERDYVHSY